MINNYKTLLLGISLGFAFAISSTLLINDEITSQMVKDTATVLGLEFTEAERDSMIQNLENSRETYAMLRDMEIKNSVPPALHFNPIPVGKTFDKTEEPMDWNIPDDVNLPENRSDLAFYTVEELASLIKNRKLTSVELTKFFLDRIKSKGDTLEAVVTLTEDRALEQARKMDRELENGNYRGPLHGIPYGAKDLFAVEGYKTTWGATPYQDQEIEETATVIENLDEAGAVLIAKTTLGALAYGDVWFDGKTRSPWNPERGSSGSSAGSASGTAAGMFPFALGTETLGSIVSPSTRNGATGLRPTFGRVSRHGAMALSWSMDKVGPLTRSVHDAAIVFDAIHGPDGSDQTIVDLPFNYEQEIDLSELKIGYLKEAFEQDYGNQQADSTTLAVLEELGADLIPIEFPDYNAGQLTFILNVEGAAAFDQLTLSGADDEMVRQSRSAWPNIFRAARIVPAVEYVQANRARYKLIQDMEEKVLQNVDVYISPAFVGGNLQVTNLTGHPSVVLPNGFDDNNEPQSITFTGDLFDEGTLLAVAKAYQEATDFHKQYPPLFED